MPVLTKDQIANVDDRDILTVEVKEWGGSVGIKVVSGADRDAYLSKIQGKKEWEISELQAFLLSKCLCDDSGNRLFTDSQEDLTLLKSKSGVVMMSLWEAAMEHNGMTEKEVQEDGEIEKNSDSAQNVDSGSA